MATTHTTRVLAALATTALSSAAAVALPATADAAKPSHTIGWVSPTYQCWENNGRATMTLARSWTSGTLTVTVQTSDDTATAGSDYTATTQTVTFQKGQPDAFVAVPILNDSEVEGTESFVVTVTSAPKGVLVSPGKTTVEIYDDEAPPAW
jgi:Calx-beta domain-containing protein